MRTRHYTGRRAQRSRETDDNYFGRMLGRTLYFPLLFIYLETVLHLYMGLSLKYFPIYLLFGLAAGCLCDAIAMPFKRVVNQILAKILAVLISLVYAIELIAKKILQSFYPFSTLGLAAENHLTDYADTIISTVLESWLILIVVMLPAILLIIFGSGLLGFPRMDIRFAGILVVLMVVFHLLGLGVVHLPWSGDLTPAMLYKVDTNIDDQVEQLGLLNMLRLDIKHMFVEPGTLLDDDFSAFDPVGPTGSQPPAVSQPPEGSDPIPTTSEKPVDRSPNVMEVDLAALAESSSDKDVQWLANYFNSVTPSNKNEYTGMFEGYNVIFFTLEGFSGYTIDPVLTPTLYKLQNEGFVFNNFYTALHFTSTSGGECQNLLGLYPKNGNPATMKQTGVLETNCYFNLAQQLGRLGYTTLGYHGNTDMYGRYASHTNLGYDWRQYQTGLELEMKSDGSSYLWPQRDEYVIEASIDDYINSASPFHVYYLTISGHMPYSNNRVVQPYTDLVRSLPYSETTQNYIATSIEVDRAMETLIQKLDAAGKLENTLIVAAPDHIPYFNVENLEEIAGEEFGSSSDLEYLNESNINFDVYKSSLIIWSASMEEPVQVEDVCCQVDILPTVSNLLGLEYDSRMLSGTDILADNTEKMVIFTSQSWMTNKGFYNRFSQTFTPAEGVTMTEEEQEIYVSNMKKIANYKLNCTELILDTNFYDILFGS